MIVDPANVTALYTGNKEERLPGATLASEPNNNNEGRVEAGATSESGPAVVTNISAAALETARAVTPPEQTANQNRPARVAEPEEPARQEAPAAPQETVVESYQQSRLDVLV